MRYLSPLRYPGGKAKLAPYFARLIGAQEKAVLHYAEPFAGGVGAGLSLLHSGIVDQLHINDINPGIAAFWRSVFYDTDRFVDLVKRTRVDIDVWHQSRHVYENPEEYDDISLAFATFFLNRTNRSGILTARPIGGLEQKGNWKIDARFNKVDLLARVNYLSTYAERVHVTEMDASDFLWSIEPYGDAMFVYVDPPYLVQGDDLYLHAYSETAHISLAAQLADLRLPWILTYDADPRISGDLYAKMRCAEFGISHTAQVQHVGKEYIVFSEGLAVPDLDVTNKMDGVWLSDLNVTLPATS